MSKEIIINTLLNNTGKKFYLGDALYSLTERTSKQLAKQVNMSTLDLSKLVGAINKSFQQNNESEDYIITRLRQSSYKGSYITYELNFDLHMKYYPTSF